MSGRQRSREAESRMHKAMTLLAKATAMIGGLVLIALIVITTVSICGRVLSDDALLGNVAAWLRGLGIGEVSGSYELLEAGVAFAIFSFFPICQLHAGHATVDIFTEQLSARARRALVAFWEVALTATLLLITVQLFGGVQRYYGNGETTFFLQFPVWWAYTASFAASVVTAIVAIYCAGMRVAESVTGRTLLVPV
jgi:TRAP-type C4-dicarboxylate transport system permease small subunit